MSGEHNGGWEECSLGKLFSGKDDVVGPTPVPDRRLHTSEQDFCEEILKMDTSDEISHLVDLDNIPGEFDAIVITDETTVTDDISAALFDISEEEFNSGTTPLVEDDFEKAARLKVEAEEEAASLKSKAKEERRNRPSRRSWRLKIKDLLKNKD